SPPANLRKKNPWGGLSGAVLFEDDTGLPFGVIGRWEDSFDLSVLGVTLLAQVEDSNPLWASARLTKPIRSTSQLRTYSMISRNLRELGYLLDRGDQIKDLSSGLIPEKQEPKSQSEAATDEKKWPPAVTIVIGRPRDEPAELLRRIERHLGAAYFSR